MIHHIEESQIREEVVRNSQKLVMIDFYAEWCMPCQMLTPILKELDQKYKELEIYKINIEEAQEITIAYGIQSVPTVLFFKNGEEVERKVGFLSYNKLSTIINEFGVE